MDEACKRAIAAAKSGDVTLLMANIHRDAEVRYARDRRSNHTLFQIAGEQGHLDILRSLVDAFTQYNNLNYVNFRVDTQEGMTTLALAIVNNRVDCVKYLAGLSFVDVNARFQYNWRGQYTALTLAIERDFELAVILMQHPKTDATTLFEGFMRDSKRFQMFFQSTASEFHSIILNKRDKRGRTLLISAVREKRFDIINRMKLLSGIDVNAADCDNKTAMEYAVEAKDWYCLFLLLTYENVRNQDKILPMIPNDDGRHYYLGFLFGHLFSSNLCDLPVKDNLSVLMYFVKCGYFHMIRHTKLISHNSCNDANLYDSKRRTALTHAALKKNWKCLEELLSFDNVESQINHQDEDGKTLLIHAVIHRRHEIVDLLKTFPNIDAYTLDKDSLSAINYAALDQDWYCLSKILTFSNIDQPQINDADKDGKSLLMIAARHGRGEIIEQLKGFASIDANTFDGCGCTALMQAIALKNRVYFDFLLEERFACNVRLRDPKGRTVLMHAVLSRSHFFVEKILKISTSDINTCDKSYRTPLLEALASKCESRTVLLLLQSGADPYLECGGISVLTSNLPSKCQEELFYDFLVYLATSGGSHFDVNRGPTTLLHHCCRRHRRNFILIPTQNMAAEYQYLRNHSTFCCRYQASTLTGATPWVIKPIIMYYLCVGVSCFGLFLLL